MKSLYQPNKIKVLTSILNGHLSLIDSFDIPQAAYPDELVIVKPSHVRNMLKRYLEGTISDVELNRWARFICCRLEYVVPGRNDYAISDFYEGAYYIIQCMSTPEIDGDIDEERIKEYLAELDAKYPIDPPEELCK